MYYAEGTHPAIIDKEMYEMAKKEMQRRRDDRNNAIGSSGEVKNSVEPEHPKNDFHAASPLAA